MAIKATVVSGVVLLALAVAYWLGADAISESTLSGGVGADGLPKLLAVALAVLSLIMIGQALARSRRLPKSSPAVSSDTDQPDAETARTGAQHLLAAGMLVLGVLFAVVLPYLGYVVSVALLLLAVACYQGKRLSFGVIAFAVIGAVVFDLIFAVLLHIRMPVGFWPALLGWI